MWCPPRRTVPAPHMTALADLLDAASQPSATDRLPSAVSKPLPRENNLANHLAELGRQEESLPAATEAANLYKELAEQRPDASRPDLARSLNNLADQLGNLGQRKEGLAAATEAMQIRRELTQQYPDGYSSELGQSLEVLAWLQQDRGSGASD